MPDKYAGLRYGQVWGKFLDNGCVVLGVWRQIVDVD